MDLEYWKTQWSKAQQTSSLYRGNLDPENWKGFWDQYANRYAMENREHYPFSACIVDTLVADGVLTEDDTVLDIGCGPGTFAIPMALKSASVTGIDTAPQMLKTMVQEADFYRIQDRVIALTASWSDIPETTTYDLVLGANTPAINDYESLMKMNRLSHRSCCLISFASTYHSSLRSAIWNLVMGEPLKSRAFDIQYPFNILYLGGFYPSIRFFPYHWSPTHTVEEMTEHYIRYFEIFHKTGPVVAEQIHAYLSEIGPSGLITDTQQGKIAVICWQAQPDMGE